MDCLFEEIPDSRIDNKAKYICIRRGCGRKTALTKNKPENIYTDRQCCGKPGLGDSVEMALYVLGIKKVKGCGCSKRQKRLNKLGALLRMGRK